MFYGKFDGDKGTKFKEALELFKQMFPRVYAQDNLITFSRNLSFITLDTEFRRAFEAQAKTQQEQSLAWRLHTLCWAAKQALKVEGDFMECGVFHGFSFAVLTDYLQFENVKKKLYLYDTYEGIPEEYNSEKRSNDVYKKLGDLAPQVKERFKKYPNVEVVKGTVPDSFKTACPDKIALLHIDMNSSASEMAALNVLYDKVVQGGMIVFDDYGWAGYDKQTVAEYKFMQERNQYIMELPTGQGVMINY
jgi:hypothetical protein